MALRVVDIHSDYIWKNGIYSLELFFPTLAYVSQKQGKISRIVCCVIQLQIQLLDSWEQPDLQIYFAESNVMEKTFSVLQAHQSPQHIGSLQKGICNAIKKTDLTS